MQRILTVAVLLLALAVSSCSKNKGKEAEKELPASIQAMIRQGDIKCTCEPYIDLYRWQDKDVYLLTYRGITCNWVPTYYDAAGTKMDMVGITLDKFIADSQLKKHIWDCK